MRKFSIFLVYFLSLGLSGCLLLLTQGPPLPHIFELASHFYLQLSLLLLIPILLLAYWRHWVGLGLHLLILAGFLSPLLLWSFQAQQAPSAQTLKILFGNLLYSNREVTPLRQWIDTENPDIVIIQELNPAHQELMQSYGRRFPYHKAVFRGDPFGLGIWSRRPLDAIQVLNLGPTDIPSLSAQVHTNQGDFYLLTSHPYPPVNPEYFKYRNAQYQALAQHLKGIEGPRVLIGDLNTTPWSAYYRRLEKQSGLSNSRRGFGLLPSWPFEFPAWLRIPIDHCLVSSEVQVIQTQLGPALGSDHLPLKIELGF